MIAAVAEASYPAVTVADIVRRARVSRAAFYALFADKEDCFLTATREAGDLMRSRMAFAVRALPAGAPDEEALRAALRAFLALSGAAVELVRSVVRNGDTGALPGLEGPIVSLYLAVLALPVPGPLSAVAGASPAGRHRAAAMRF